MQNKTLLQNQSQIPLTLELFTATSKVIDICNQLICLLNFSIGSHPHSRFISLHQGRIELYGPDEAGTNHQRYSFIDISSIKAKDLLHALRGARKELIKTNEGKEIYIKVIEKFKQAHAQIVGNTQKNNLVQNLKSIESISDEQKILYTIYNQYYQCLGAEKTLEYFDVQDEIISLTTEGCKHLQDAIQMLLSKWHVFDTKIEQSIFQSDALLHIKNTIVNLGQDDILAFIESLFESTKKTAQKSIFLNSLGTYLRVVQGINIGLLQESEIRIKKSLQSIFAQKEDILVEVRAKDILSIIIKILTQTDNTTFYGDFLGTRITLPDTYTDDKKLQVLRQVHYIIDTSIKGVFTEQGILLESSSIAFSNKGVIQDGKEFIQGLTQNNIEVYTKKPKKTGLSIDRQMIDTTGNQIYQSFIQHIAGGGKTGVNGGYKDAKSNLVYTVDPNTYIGVENMMIHQNNTNNQDSSHHHFLNAQKSIYKGAREGVITSYGSAQVLIQQAIYKISLELKNKKAPYIYINKAGQDINATTAWKHSLYDNNNNTTQARLAIQKDLTVRWIQEGRIRVHIYSDQLPLYATIYDLVDAMIYSPDDFFVSGNNITNNFITHNTSKIIANKELTPGWITWSDTEGKIYSIRGDEACMIASNVLEKSST